MYTLQLDALNERLRTAELAAVLGGGEPVDWEQARADFDAWLASAPDPVNPEADLKLRVLGLR